MEPPPPSPERLSEMRNRFRRGCEDRGDRRVLVLIEGVNAAGKDGLIEELISVLADSRVRVERCGRPVLSNPRRDIFHNVRLLAPTPGELVVFNRTYYGHAVHAARQGLHVTDCCDRIVRFERELVESGTALVKVFLHIDKHEQLRRLEDRQQRPELRHLHNPRDYDDQESWDEVIRAYETVMSHTHTASSPWLVVASNDRSIRNYAVESVLLARIVHDG
jgi:polyphosphate kinase 2 (PPK2 family)